MFGKIMSYGGTLRKVAVAGVAAVSVGAVLVSSPPHPPGPRLGRRGWRVAGV